MRKLNDSSTLDLNPKPDDEKTLKWILATLVAFILLRAFASCSTSTPKNYEPRNDRNRISTTFSSEADRTQHTLQGPVWSKDHLTEPTFIFPKKSDYFR
ncbi:hypothetical protein ACKGJO_06480 [Gracilimonas sp. Q87]|uniref:hypothetical protein n=1 Tax=Gracilimonas sp. Q87 TaxID=3384766 RepID=UPI0039845973